jgi:hypothetical protein
VEGIKARLQAQGFVHLAVPGNILHQVKAAEPNGTVLQQVLADLGGVRFEVRGALRIDSGRRPDLQRTVRDFLGLSLGLRYVYSVESNGKSA